MQKEFREIGTPFFMPILCEFELSYLIYQALLQWS